MSKPTNEQLNEAAARTCGHMISNTIRFGERKWYSLKGEILPRDYCTDRNALPELWDALEKASHRFEFLGCIRNKLEEAHDWTVHTSDPRLQVICFLHVMGQWPEDWSEE